MSNQNSTAKELKSKRTKSIVTLVITFVLLVAMGVMCLATFPVGKTKQYNSIMSLIGKGIDLSGGYYVVLTPKIDSDDTASANEKIESAMEILRTRLDDKGFTEATISRQDGDRIRVEVPEVDNAQEVLQIIGNTGTLSFQDSTKHEYLNGEDHIKDAYVSYDQNNGYVVVLEFTKSGIEKFSAATATIKDMSDNKMYIYLGDTCVSSPEVKEQINNKSAEITGYDDYDSAEAIASVIKSGTLPIEYDISESRSISARLGAKAITSSVIAAAVAMAIIFVLMIVIYHGMGIAASIALIFYAFLYIIFLAIIPNVQLTLPGIAGILLSIGMAVDANVVIFERIKSAFKDGKTSTAFNEGFKSALLTIIDSNVTTILAAIVLWILCPGTIKGFAITLLVGIVLSLFTSILVTKWYLDVLKSFDLDTNNDKKNSELELTGKFFNLKKEVK